jgi:hypothetical protein
MLNYYDFTAAISGAEFRISAAGTYLRYYSGAASGLDSRIVVKCDSRSLAVVLKPGQAVRLDAADGKAVDWRLSNYAKQADISGFVVIGDGQLDDSTITGDVNVVDGGLSRTLANQAYIGYAFCAAVAAQYSHTQLWNPAGSGKNLFLETFNLSSPTAGTLIAGRFAAQYGSASTAVVNKYFGGAAGVGIQRYTNNAVPQITEYAASYSVAANVAVPVELREPILIPPGQGFIASHNMVNAAMTCVHEWYEQAI